MKTITLLFSLLALFQIGNAQKLIAKNGQVGFVASTPLETNIEGHNHQVVSILDPSTGDIAFNLLVKSFEFKVALMQEHFNENYMESDKYPKSTFKGKITNNSNINYKKDGIYVAEVSGDLTIHNVTKPVTAKGTIEVKGSTVTAKSDFIVKPADYGIVIPAVVENKVAKEAKITVDVDYTSN